MPSNTPAENGTTAGNEPEATIPQKENLIDKLFEDYRRATTTEEKKKIFKALTDVLQDEYSTQHPAEIQAKVLGLFPESTRSASDFIRIGHYYESIEKRDEAIESYKNSNILQPSYKAVCNIANIYCFKSMYQEAINHFEKALKFDNIKLDDKLKVLYNYGFTLSLEGNYKKARQTNKLLTQLFATQTEKDGEYWLDYGDHCLYNLFEPFEAVQKYEAGLESTDLQSAEHIKLLSNLVNACNKCMALDTYRKPHEVNQWRAKANRYYKRAHQLIQDTGRPSHKKLGELYFYNRNLEEALKSFHNLEKSETSSVGEEIGDVAHFLGLCYLYSENYQLAIVHFKKSVHINHSTFATAYLAECYLKLSKFSEAEYELDRTLHTTPKHTNALISQTYLYRDWADSLKTTNAEKAVALLDKSNKTACLLLANSEDVHFQRNLTYNEISELRYIISYCQVEKFNLLKSKSARMAALQEAKPHLTELARANDNAYYFRSNRALHEVDKILSDVTRSGLARKGPLMLLGMIATVIAFFMIFIGKPFIRKGFEVDSAMLATQVNVSKASIDSTFKGKLFSSKTGLQEYVKAYFGDKIPASSNPTHWAEPNEYHFSAEPVDATLVALVLSIGVVFLVLGMISNELKVLKVGVIHIEKTDTTTMDQVELKMDR